jgi:peptide/nickel transport system ATP-binding protein
MTADEAPPLLQFKDVSLTYRTSEGEVPAVRGVSLVVNAGEVVGLAGESGCGKTTLASTVLRLQPKSAKVTGEILLNGQNTQTMSWGKLRAARWSEASVVFQGAMHSLDPLKKIGRQLSEPILLHSKSTGEGDARTRVAELLSQVGLPARAANAYPHQLSGGQKQRVMIALALACEPQLIVADEPTTALDVMVQAQVLNLIASIVREFRVGMLIISHDLSVLGTECDRVAVMYAGRIVESGPAHAVFRDALHPYARALSGAFPTIGDPHSRYRPEGLQGDPPDPAALPGGCAFHVRCPLAFDGCDSEDPSLLPLLTDPGRQVACRLHADATGAATRRGVAS